MENLWEYTEGLFQSTEPVLVASVGGKYKVEMVENWSKWVHIDCAVDEVFVFQAQTPNEQ